MQNDTGPQYRTITLTDRPPVRITEGEWPIIASGDASEDDATQCGNRPNREWARTIRVRRHDDGRAIIYAIYAYDTAFQSEKCARARRGELLPATATDADVVAAIQRVARDIAAAEDGAAIDQTRRDPSRWESAMHECIADLPAEAL